jgi:hypothetical protein
MKLLVGVLAEYQKRKIKERFERKEKRVGEECVPCQVRLLFGEVENNDLS